MFVQHTTDFGIIGNGVKPTDHESAANVSTVTKSVLEDADLSNNLIETLPPIAHPKLRVLRLRNNGISALSGLDALSRLEARILVSPFRCAMNHGWLSRFPLVTRAGPGREPQ
jgi:hypothetical protein